LHVDTLPRLLVEPFVSLHAHALHHAWQQPCIAVCLATTMCGNTMRGNNHAWQQPCMISTRSDIMHAMRCTMPGNNHACEYAGVMLAMRDDVPTIQRTRSVCVRMLRLTPHVPHTTTTTTRSSRKKRLWLDPKRLLQCAIDHATQLHGTYSTNRPGP
jgi:hypothetical protein